MQHISQALYPLQAQASCYSRFIIESLFIQARMAPMPPIPTCHEELRPDLVLQPLDYSHSMLL